VWWEGGRVAEVGAAVGCVEGAEGFLCVGGGRHVCLEWRRSGGRGRGRGRERGLSREVPVYFLIERSRSSIF
jgi:hypothetical protein